MIERTSSQRGTRKNLVWRHAKVFCHCQRGCLTCIKTTRSICVSPWTCDPWFSLFIVTWIWSWFLCNWVVCMAMTSCGDLEDNFHTPSLAMGKTPRKLKSEGFLSKATKIHRNNCTLQHKFKDYCTRRKIFGMEAKCINQGRCLWLD